MLRRTGFLAVLLSIMALLAFQVSPAFAHHKDSHEGGDSVQQADHEASDHDGDADSDASTSYTEDNDTNDNNTPNNSADEGDNFHPSGKDRSVEGGGSGNQGNSESDPDDDGRGPDRSNGGPDKPNGSGGDDPADQDGNNGCGNDDDFEDDNEGWCGQKPKPGDDEVEATDEEKPCDADSDMTNGVQVCEDDSVIAPVDDSDDEIVEDEVGVDEEPALPTDDVLGLRVRGDRDLAVAPAVRGARVRGGVLPFTGGDVLGFIFLALGLVAAGYLMLRTRRI